MHSVVRRLCVVMLLLSAGLLLAACGGSLAALHPPAEEPIYGSLLSEKSLDKGKKYYRDGDYGLAEKAFRKAIEEDKDNAEAWLGLAASYDRLQRFDLADRAYKIVIKMTGNSPTVLNNLGYHYLLRGDYANARVTLAAAQKADPNNLFVKNNLALIDEGGVPPSHKPAGR